MNRFFGMMLSSEIKIEEKFTDNDGEIVTI